ncbi:dihydrofolate reductase [Kocuria sp. cx-455]|uniref:dihydrofolate reductase family protein n=1 Tax=unclassified Candidatus Sulfotelmatobacter TaxID=2635724 RepID=UPI00168592F0|nr:MULTISPECIES: dihydrofolate reductase family protein [unclassified Candidatus Sulfotelmatobacter]MBD2763159.1 dihydrofolate reductase [Kocuria sp. cx-116]MBD2765863.1 dihydrofolate reductase [Kocuria sp. cx-455]
MSKLVLIEFLTVDGVMQGLGSPQEDTEGGFTRGGWGAPFAESIHQVVAPTGLANTSGYLFGRKTYEKMAAFWPFQPDSNPMAAHLNAAPKYVASRTLHEVAWAGTAILSSDLGAAARELKRTGNGDIAVLGSGDLCRQLLADSLVDELRLFIHPLLLGAGKRLFGELPMPKNLELKSVAQTSLGTVAVIYGVQ